MADNAIYAGNATKKMFLNSGQYTTTLLDSQAYLQPEALLDITYDGNDIAWTGDTANKAYLQSGLFSSTIKVSTAVLYNGQKAQTF